MLVLTLPFFPINVILFLVKDAQKTAELNFDQHEELITELHPLKEPEANGYRKKDYSFNRIKRYIHAAFTLWNVGFEPLPESTN